MQENYTNIALFILRLALGVIFIVNGIQKMFTFSGEVQYLADLGLPAATVVAILLVAIELIGGLAVLVGWWTRVAASLLAVIMLGALILVTGPEGFYAAQGDVMILAGAIALVLMGPGTLRIRFAHEVQPKTSERPTSGETNASNGDGDNNKHI